MPDKPAANIVNSVVHQWSLEVMEKLLYDRTTKQNIIWADTEYEELGEGYQPYDEIKIGSITGFHSGIIKTRVMKDASIRLASPSARPRRSRRLGYATR